MSFHVGDDGTMDTVIVCDDCGAELRFNYDYDHDLDGTQSDEDAYSQFVEWALEEAGECHECDREHKFEPSNENTMYCQHCGASETGHRA